MTPDFMTIKEKQEFWQAHIEAWQESNLSQAEYCRRNNLPIKSFGYRKRRMLESSNQEQLFVPVTIQAEPVRTFEEETPLRLALQNGLKIEVAGDFNPGILQKLIRVAEAV